MSKIILKLVDRLIANATAYERLLQKRDELTDERDELHNKVVTLSANLTHAKGTMANYDKVKQRLKNKNDVLNADVKSAAGMLRTIHAAGVLNNEETKAVEELCGRLGYPVRCCVDAEELEL